MGFAEEAGKELDLEPGSKLALWGDEAGAPGRKPASVTGGTRTGHMQLMELWGHQERGQMSGAEQGL